jgi:hypothetical protein
LQVECNVPAAVATIVVAAGAVATAAAATTIVAAAIGCRVMPIKSREDRELVGPHLALSFLNTKRRACGSQVGQERGPIVVESVEVSSVGWIFGFPR